MNEYLLPLVATAGAALATYWFCIRPMRRGQHGTGQARRGCCPPTPPVDDDLGEEIRQARQELDRLRHNTGTTAKS